MTVAERLKEEGYEDILIFTDFGYDDAFIGVSNDERAIYDYDKMIEWLEKTQDFTREEAVEWIDYNTVRALPYYGDRAPIILYRMEW